MDIPVCFSLIKSAESHWSLETTSLRFGGCEGKVFIGINLIVAAMAAPIKALLNLFRPVE